jgi:cell wall assembly regulator SMI1
MADKDMISPARAVLKYWEANDVRYLPGNRPAQIRRFEERVGCVMPADMREFYLLTDGTYVPGTGGCDHNAFYFWRLRDVQQRFGGFAFEFCDYREESWRYGVDFVGEHIFGPGGIYFLYDKHDNALPVAPTFGDFLKAYINDDARLYPP